MLGGLLCLMSTNGTIKKKKSYEHIESEKLITKLCV